MLKSTLLTISPILVTLFYVNETQVEEVRVYDTVDPVKIEVIVPQIDTKEIHCMALNIYHEARNESVDGQIAVANVTMNRAEDSRFPSTICGVVYQAKMSSWWKEKRNKEVPIRNACQFSWYCDGKSDKVREINVYNKIYVIAEEVLMGLHKDNTHGSTHYHANYVNPYWASSLQRVAYVDNHIFYSGY